VTRRPRGRWRLAVSLLLMTLGCRHVPHPYPPEPPPLSNKEENRKNLEAMVTIRAYAYWRGNPPAAFAAMPLDDALKRLNDRAVFAWDRTAASRRRRAIAMLAAYGRGVETIDRALRRIGVSTARIEKAVEEQERILGGAVSENAEDRATLIADLPEVAEGARDGESGASARIDANCWKKLHTSVYPERDVSIVVDVEANNSVARVAKGLDPQSWSECGTAWKTGKGTYLAHPEGSKVISDTPVTPRGEAYTKRSFYENFVCLTGFCSAQFELFLGLTATKSSDMYHVEFWLTPSDNFPKGTVFGASEDLLIDEGNLDAKPSTTSGWSAVHGQKKISFRSDSTTSLVASYLQQVELASELGELACCFMQ
jgi:hypothetical protein